MKSPFPPGLAVLLVCYARADQPQTVPCRYVPPECPDVTYDLSVLRQTAAHDLYGIDALGQDYYVRVCETPAEPCSFATNASEMAGVQTWSAPQGAPSCASIGNLRSATWSMLEQGKEKAGVQISFTGGDDGRSSVFQFECDPKMVGLVQLVNVKQTTAQHVVPAHYALTFASAAACPTGHCPIPPMSAGWYVVIFFPVGVALYLILGVVYNKKVHDAEGLEVLPQWRYWVQLPGLVADGVAFSWRTSLWAARVARTKFRECRDASGTREMRDQRADLLPSGEE